MNELFPDFKDRRGRVWEWYKDVGYYDMICIRVKEDRDFNSLTAFHFHTYDLARAFKELLEVSC